MSGSAGAGGAWKWVVPLLVAVGLTVWLVPSSPPDTSYDLDAPEPNGYRGLRLLLEAFGTDVEEIDAADVGADLVADRDVVFVPLGDGVGEDLARSLRAYVSGGGRVVLGAPSVWLGATSDEASLFDEPTWFPMDGTGVCTMGDLAGSGTIALPVFAAPLDVGDGDSSCYGDGELAIVVRDGGEDGDGVVTLSSPDLFTNEAMGAPEPEQPIGTIPANAVVAQRLLGQRAGNPARLAVVTSGLDATVGSGEKQLTDFMSTGVKLGLLELAAAVAFYAVARGRRYGRVVTEAEPVAIAGSAFVEAVGSLLERQGDVGRAAEVVRSGHCRDLQRRLGQQPGASRDRLAAVIAERTGRDPAAVTALLTSPVETEADLLTLTRELDSLRQEALHV